MRLKSSSQTKPSQYCDTALMRHTFCKLVVPSFRLFVTANSRFTDNGDARVHYLDSGGDDRGAPVVFVPGMTDIADDYTAVMPIFGRRVVVVEIRGHGRSSSPPSDYDLATLSGDVGAVVDAVTDGPVHIATFSRGTSAALWWTIEHPDRVRSIAIGDYTPDERVLTSTTSQQLLDGGWRGTPVRDRLDEHAAGQDIPCGTETFDVGAAIAIATSAAGGAQWQQLAGRRRRLARYRELFPGAQLVEFDDSPHDIFRPDRGRYPRLVRDHVDRAEARGAAPRRQH